MAFAVLAAALFVFYASFLTGRCFLWEDLLYMTYPAFNCLATALASGRFPMWVPGLHDGTPLFCEPWVYYPPIWSLALFVREGHLSSLVIQWYSVGQILMGGMFMYLFLAGHRLVRWASIAGAVLFACSGFLSLHIVHGGLGHAFLWLPLELYFVRRIVNRQSPEWSYLGLILSIMMSFLAGFPQYVLYNAYFMGLYWLYLVALGWRGGTRPVPHGGLAWMGRLALEGLKIAGVMVVVALLCMVVILPLFQAWGETPRQEYGFDKIADESMPWYYLIHGVVANFFGASNGDGCGVPYWGFNKDTQAYRIWHGGYWMYMEFAFYAGQLALIAVVVGFANARRLWRERRELVFFLFALPPLVLLMLGRYGLLYTLFFKLVPGFSLFRTPPRISALVSFCSVVVVAMVFDAVLQRRPELGLRRPLLAAGGAFLAFFGWFALFGVDRFPELASPALWSNACAETVISMGFFAVLAAGLLLVASARFNALKPVLAPLLVGVAFFDLYHALHHFHQGSVPPEKYYADRNGLVSQMVQMRDQNGPFRLAQLRDGKISEEIIFPRNTAYLYPGLEVLEGYLMFNLNGYIAFNAVTNDRVRLDIQNVGLIANADPASGRVALMRYTNALPRVKFYDRVKSYADVKPLCAALDAGTLDYRRELGVMEGDQRRYTLPVNAGPGIAPARVSLTQKTPEWYQIAYETARPGVVFISESFYPGWEADGGRRPIIKVFGAFKGIVITEAGKGVIDVRFSPASLRHGVVISGTTLLVLLITVAALAWRRRRQVPL